MIKLTELTDIVKMHKEADFVWQQKDLNELLKKYLGLSSDEYLRSKWKKIK